jgi:mono/diheme cytochrome c family protein
MKTALAAAILVARIGWSAVDFGSDVHPILAARCFICHGGDKRSGGLSLSTYSEILRGGKTGKVVNPGSSRDSLLLQRVLAAGVPPMPPVGERLSASEIAVLRAWIDEGARPRQGAVPARANWVPRMALVKPAVPESADPNPIDRFMRAYFSQQGVEPPELVADAAFARRAYLDVWGLLPTRAVGGVHRIWQARCAVRDLLANNSNYSEHWITFWNDLLRNEEGSPTPVFERASLDGC